MKSIVKKSLALLLAGLILAGFAGCISPGADKPGTEPEITSVPSEAPTEASSGAPSEDYPLPENPDAVGDCVKDAEVLLHIPYGDEKEGVGLTGPDAERDWYNGPESFTVADGKIYLLDTIKRRVIVSDGETTDYIDISEPLAYWTQIAVIGDKLYLGDSSEEIPVLAVFDMTGNKLEDIELPDRMMENGISKLFTSNGHLAIYDNELVFYKMEDDGFSEVYDIGVDPVAEPKFTVTFGDNEIGLDTGDNTRPGVQMIRDDRIYLEVLGYDPDADTESIREVSYRVYDFSGKLLGATAVDRRELFTLSGSKMYVSPEGELYVMCCMKDGVYVTKPHLRAE